MGNDEARCQRGFRAAGTMLGTMLAVTLAAQLPAVPGTGWLRGQRATARAVWPQAWAFFANAGRAPLLVAYRAGPGGRLTPATLPGLDRTHLWGLSRVGESETVESRQLAQLIPAREWWSCGAGDPRQCLRAAGGYPVTNRSRRPTLCGLVLFTLEQPVNRPPGGYASGRTVAMMALAELACTR